ncbi:MAG: hypothetical protein U0324_07205 [Polyangiales bacterium]
MSPRTPTAAALSLALALGATEALAVVQVTVEVNPPRPAAGQAFHVVYGLRVDNDGMATATPLQFPGLQVLANAAPPSTQNMMVFGGFGGMGSITVQSSAEYIVMAPRAGRYVIRNARAVNDRGQVVAQLPDVTVTVDPPGTAQPQQPVQAPPPNAMPFPGMIPGFPNGILAPDTPPPPAAVDPDAPPSGEIAASVYDPTGFVRLAVDKPTPYVGEQVTFRAWLYVPSGEVGCDAQHEPVLTGFWNEQLLDRGQTRCWRGAWQVVAGGRQMIAGLVRKIALFPTRSGRQEIGGMEVIAEYIEGDAFFGQRRRIQVRSPTIVVDVREPPTEGRPDGYVPGLIGPLAITAELDRPSAPTGETVTLRLRAVGNGYLGAVGLPAPPRVDGLRMHPGSSRHEVDRSNEADVRGTLVSEHLVVAERPGTYALGVLNVPWFDPANGRYGTSTIPLPTLTATGPAPERDVDATREDPTVALDPLVESPSLTPYRTFFTSPARVWGTVAFPPALLVAAGLARGLRRWRARRATEKVETERNDPLTLVARSEAALTAGDRTSALDLAGRALERARRAYGDAGLDDAGRAALREAQAACDTVRFGAEGDAADVVAKVRDVVRAMERAS